MQSYRLIFFFNTLMPIITIVTSVAFSCSTDHVTFCILIVFLPYHSEMMDNLWCNIYNSRVCEAFEFSTTVWVAAYDEFSLHDRRYFVKVRFTFTVIYCYIKLQRRPLLFIIFPTVAGSTYGAEIKICYQLLFRMFYITFIILSDNQRIYVPTYHQEYLCY